MAIDRVASLKRCRALGIEPAVVGLSKKSKRQPKRTNRKVSEYGIQLKEKQKAKFIYGILEKQFRGYYEKAKKMLSFASAWRRLGVRPGRSFAMVTSPSTVSVSISLPPLSTKEMWWR